jgi:hypothetical protein
VQQIIHATNSWYKIHLDYKNNEKPNIFFKVPLNFVGNSTSCFNSNGNLLKILIPVKYAPFSYILNEEEGR